MPELRLHDKGPDVERLQEELNLKLSPSPELEVDGDFGEATQAAVRRFQKQTGMRPADGVATIPFQSALRGAVVPPPRSRGWVDIAVDQIRDQGLPGRRSAYYQAGGVIEGSDWCSAFVNWVMNEGGYEGTGSGLASSWTEWGVPCEPHEGAIVILYDAYFDHPAFPNNPWPHVGFLLKVNEPARAKTVVGKTPVHLGIGLTMVGGNQGNAVSAMTVSPGPNCSYPPYIAGAAFRQPSLADLRLVHTVRRLMYQFIPPRGPAPAAPAARRIGKPPAAGTVVLGEEGSFGPFDEGVRTRTDRADLSGIRAKLQLPAMAGAGDGDYTYFNFYVGMSAEVEAGISFTVNNPKFTDRGPQWRRFLNPGGPSLLFTPAPWSATVDLELVIDADASARFSVNGSTIGTIPIRSGESSGPMKLVMAVHNGPKQNCWYTTASFLDVEVRDAGRSRWSPWPGGQTVQIRPHGNPAAAKPQTRMTVTQASPPASFLMPAGVGSIPELRRLLQQGHRLRTYK